MMDRFTGYFESQPHILLAVVCWLGTGLKG
nr:MAG TPA: hypothetical protein [Caudoviricetes sp.]